MARISNYGLSNYGLDAPQSDSAVSAIRNSPGVAAQSGSKMAEPQSAAIDRLQRAKDITKRQIDQMGQISTETPGGIFGRKWSYGGKVYTDQQLADAKSAVDRAQNDDEIYQAIRNLANANDQSEVGTGVGGMLARGMNNTPIPSIGNNSFLGNNRTKYEYPEDDSSWAYTIGKYGGGGLEFVSDVSGAADTLKMAKAARFNPFTFAGMLYRDAKQTGKDIVNLPRNIVNGIRNAGSKTSNFVKDSVKAGTEGKSLKAYNAERTAAPAGETAQTGGRAAETAAPAAERTAASETAAPAAERTAAPAPRQEPAPAPRQEPAPQQPAPAPERTAPQQPAPAPERTAASETAAPAAERTAASETAADGGVSELANAGSAGRSSADEAMEVAAGIDELVRRIKSGAVDEMDKAWIQALADQKAAGSGSETINYILDAARAAGVIK